MGKRKQLDSPDFDIALATLIALLEPSVFPHDDYVDALSRAHGDVSGAAEILLLNGASTSSANASASNGAKSKKAKQKGLQGWLSATRKEPSPPSPAAWQREEKVSPSSPPLDRKASAANWANLLSRPPSGAASVVASTRAAPQRALHLTPAALEKHNLPLVFLPSPLSPSMAAALYHELIAESPEWRYNKFFLAGREVESNHQASNYARKGGGFEFTAQGQYYYTGAAYEAKEYPPMLAKAADLVEAAVNRHLESVPRYPLELKGRWRANVCGTNRYDGAVATVGWHADQLTYLGPYCTIASLSLGTPRAFRLRPTAAVDEAYAATTAVRTYEVTLGHNTLCLMTPGCQERYKHTIPPQRALDVFRLGWDADGNPIPSHEQESYTTRINITFRFYREDFNPTASVTPRGPRDGTPVCKCGIPALLRADQKAKARLNLGSKPGSSGIKKDGVVDDDMVFFWQCQSPGTTGQLKGCGFFKILDMKGEGRGPCWGDEADGDAAPADAEAETEALVEVLKAEVAETGTENGQPGGV